MDTTGKEWYIEVPWGRICVVACGSCLDPPVLLVHGMGDNAASFLPLVSALPPKFYYIAIELPGMGRSDRFPQGMMISMYELVYTVDVIVKHFRWTSFDYIGHGLGAIVGKMYNHSVPNKISKLTEIDPINFNATAPDDFANWYHKNFTRYYKNIDRFNVPIERSPKISREQVVTAMVEGRKIKKDVAENILDRCTVTTSDGYVRHTVDLRYSVLPLPPLSPEYIRSTFLTTNTPTLHILSTESLKNNRYGNTDFLQEESNYPHRNYLSFKVEGSHDVHIQSPEKVGTVIGHFLLGSIPVADTKSKL